MKVTGWLRVSLADRKSNGLTKRRRKADPKSSSETSDDEDGVTLAKGRGPSLKVGATLRVGATLKVRATL